MPSRPIQFEQGSYYHIYNRGADRRSIFVDDGDFKNFLWRIQQYRRQYAVTVIAYCLMFNHFHFLVRQDGPDKAGLVFQHTCNGYAQRFNNRYDREGTLFQGRFRVVPITDDTHPRHLCRYIHGNPVKDGFAIRPELWIYSNYLDWIGERNGSLIDEAFISTHFGTPEQYAEYFRAYLSGAATIPEEVRIYFADL